MTELRTRFKGAPWFKQTDEVGAFITIVGVGGIGSRVVLLLHSLGKKIQTELYDAEYIGEENIVSQFFDTQSVGRPKVTQVRNIVDQFVGPHSLIIPHILRFEEGYYAAPITIAAVDNMKARQDIFSSWVNSHKTSKNALFLDGRMNAEQYQVFAVTPDRIEEYKKTLFSDEEIPDEPCTYKNTGHFGWLIAVRLTQMVTAFLANKETGDEIYVLPFKVSEVGPVFNINIEL